MHLLDMLIGIVGTVAVVLLVRPLSERSGVNSALLLTVLGIAAFLTLIMFAATGFAINQVKQVRDDQDWNAALAAAQAGVDEYISRLNSDGTYWRFGNPSSPYSTGSTMTLPTGASANAAFTGWQATPGTTTRSWSGRTDFSPAGDSGKPATISALRS